MVSIKRLVYIDVWRCIAISLVLLSHIIEYSHPFYAAHWPGLIWRAHPLGQLGVQIFFCISGYVICRGMIRESASSGAVGMRAFYLRRVFRIMPPLLMYGALLALMTWSGMISVRPGQFAQSALFACNIQAVGDCGWFLGHTWSLAFEEQFYLIFPLVFAVSVLRKGRHRLLAMSVALTLAALGVRLASIWDVGYYLTTFTFMLWGCVYALYQDDIASSLARLPVLAWSALAFGLVLQNCLPLPQLYEATYFPTFAPALICIAVFGTPLRHPLVRTLFNWRRLAYMGQISYMVYLLQQVATANHGFASPLPALGLVGLAIWLAHLSYGYIEMPLVRFGVVLSARLDVAPSRTLLMPTDGAEMPVNPQAQA